MKKKKNCAILLGISLTSTHCDRVFPIFIKNNSNHTIYVYHLQLDSLALYQINSVGYKYRTGFNLTSTFNWDGKDTTFYSSKRAEPSSCASIGFRGTRKDFFKFNCKDGKLRIFIFKEETLLEHSWEEICAKQMYEKKITVTEAELKANDWTVVYE